MAVADRRVVTALNHGAVVPYGPEIPWGNDGSAVIVATSAAIRPRATIAITGLSATLTTAGSSTTTVALLKNGTSVHTLNITAGQTYNFVQFAVPVRCTARVDYYQVAVTAAGSGATGIAGALELAT